MGAARETANIWWLMRTKWGWRRLFSLKFWRYAGRTYAWGDSVGQYWHRITCRLFGHRRVKDVADPGEPVQLYCFDCYNRVEGPYIGPVNRLALSKFKRKSL